MNFRGKKREAEDNGLHEMSQYNKGGKGPWKDFSDMENKRNILLF